MTTPATRLWQSYRNEMFDGPLPLNQERELSLAFYAGIEITFRIVEKIACGDMSDNLRVRILKQFRDDAREAASLANLDRATGKS